MHSLLIPYANWVHSPIISMHVNMFYHRISVLNSVQFLLTNKKDFSQNWCWEEFQWGEGSGQKGLIMLGRIQPKKTVKTCKKTILANAENIPPKKFHIIFLRKFSHAFSQFHQKSRFIGYLLHSSCYFIEYYYYYYHQKKNFFWGQVILILNV